MCVVRGYTFQQGVTISTQQVRRWLLGQHEPLKGRLEENMLFSHQVVSGTLRSHEIQHSRLPCPSLSPRACSDSCLLSQWCHPTISSSVAPFYLLPPLFPIIRVFSNESALHVMWPKYRSFSFSIVPSSNIQGWFPLELTGLLSSQPPCCSRDSQESLSAPQLLFLFFGGGGRGMCGKTVLNHFKS